MAAIALPAHAPAARPGAPVAVAATKTLKLEGTRIGPRRYAFVVRSVRPRQVRGGVARLGRHERRLSAGWIRRALRRGRVVRIRFPGARGRRRAVLELELDVRRPTPPRSLTVTTGDGTATLRWDAASDDVQVMGYRVSVGMRPVAKLGARARSFVMRGLEDGGTYLFVVRAIDEARHLSRAAWAWAATPAAAAPPAPAPTPTPAPRPDVVPPTAPTNLTATPGDKTVSLGWQPSHDDVAIREYRVYRDRLRVATTHVTHWNDAGLVNGTSYRYTVRAFDTGGNHSPMTPAVTVTPHVAVGAAIPPRLPESSGATFYVSPDGDDGDPGSAAAPWQTVQKAADTLKPGQTALVRAGAYDQDVVITRAGTASEPITIKAYPGEHPVLGPATGNTDDIPMTITNGSAYLRLQGLTFAGATGPGTTNLWVAGDAHDIEISDCEDRNSARQGFFSDATTQRVQIIGCYFHDNGGSGPPQLDHNLYIEGTGHAVLGNLIARSPNGHGIQIYPVSDHVLVADNTITGAYFAGILLGGGAEKASDNATIVNNIVTGNRIGIYTFWDGTPGTGDVIRRNLVGDNSESDFAGTGAELRDNVVSADPLFADPVHDDFHLQAGSPALDIAVPEYTMHSDLDHVPRPQGPGPDLGAYER